QSVQGGQFTEVSLYGQPLLHITFGMLGAVLGSCVWRPLPTLAMPEFPTDKQAKPPRPQESIWSALKGPAAWGRGCSGIGMLPAGLLWGPNLLSVLLHTGGGQLRVNDQLQAQLVTWEIIGLATLLGAAVAGATTRNGLKQGLFVGMGTSIVLIGNTLGQRGLETEYVFYLTCSILCLTVAGGWFGGQLFPPVLPRMRRRLTSAASR